MHRSVPGAQFDSWEGVTHLARAAAHADHVLTKPKLKMFIASPALDCTFQRRFSEPRSKEYASVIRSSDDD